MSAVAGTRRTLYRMARLLGDVQALRRGPAAYGRRLIRKAVYRRGNGFIGALLRGMGLYR